MNNKDILDVLKYILAIMIVAIHSALFPYVLFPWLRIAVPLFFMISSFLLFSKINAVETGKKKDCLKKYVIRNLQLFTFWFVVLLPLTLFYRKEWMNEGIISYIRLFVTHLLFSGSFKASWFIVSSIWASIILFFTRKINWKFLLLLFSLIYIICCMRSAYFSLFQNNNIVLSIVNGYEYIFTSPVFSFPVAVFWMFIGKCFAEKRFQIIKVLVNRILIIIFAIGLFIEWKFVISLGGLYNSDCFIMLAPLSTCIFASVKDIRINFKYAKTLRTISTITYPLHASIVPVFSHFIDNSLIVFIFVLCLCHIVSYIIMALEKKPAFHILKYSH